jgi:hypothetical protein
MKKTQLQIVREHLEKYNVIDNYWCIDTRLTTRLGAIIHTLRSEGMVIDGNFGKNLGKNRKNWKNYYYSIVDTFSY